MNRIASHSKFMVFQFYQASSHICQTQRKIQMEACIHTTVKLLTKICSSILAQLIYNHNDLKSQITFRNFRFFSFGLDHISVRRVGPLASDQGSSESLPNGSGSLLYLTANKEPHFGHPLNLGAHLELGLPRSKEEAHEPWGHGALGFQVPRD